MTRITTSTSVGLNLNPALYTSPIVVDHGVTITNPFYPSAVYSDPSYPAQFAIRNHGVIEGGSTGIGIDLTAGGSVFNGRGATISGGAPGAVEISGSTGTVLNAGAILGGGVYLQAGGVVFNAAHGSISTVYITGGLGSVVNHGTIENSIVGVYLQSGGVIVNAVGGTIIGDGNYFSNGADGAEGILMAAAGTVVNYGSVAGPGFAGVLFLSGGTLINRVGGSITGLYRGVESDNGPGTVINYGTITATARSCEGVLLGSYSPGIIVNNPGGEIVAAWGVSVSGAETAINSGYIGGRYSGISMGDGAEFINAQSGTVIGNNSFGVAIGGGATVVNAGTIIGNSGTAVYGYNPGGSGDRLVLYPSFAFGGLVVGDKYTSNTLELASAASTGTVTGLGTEIVHFGPIVFDPGAQWSVAGVARAFDGPISGFAAGDSLDLTGLAANSYTYSGGELTLLKNGKPVQTLTISTPYSASHFYINPDGGGGTLLTVAPAAGATSFTFDDISPAQGAGINLQTFSHGSIVTTAPPYPGNPVLAANPVPAASSALPQSYAHTGPIPPS